MSIIRQPDNSPSSIWHIQKGILDRTFRSAFVWSHTIVGREGLAIILRSNSFQRCSIGFIHTRLFRPCLYGPCFVHWCTVMLEQEELSPNCSHKVGSMELSNISLYADPRFGSVYFNGMNKRNTFFEEHGILHANNFSLQ